ncbi:hypothetical protein ABEH22_22725 [Pantoea agglomerans]|uniref:hypothetical protein n=1 Tax=Enterobacter agglomerans TaxID=549 RepID=UPI00320A6BBC
MKIIGIEKGLSSKELDFGDRYLILDAVPGRTWASIFEKQYSNYHSPNKRKVTLQNDNLIVKCPADELQALIYTLNGIVKAVDEEIEAMRLRAEQQAQEQARREAEQKKKADDVYDNLNFDS